MIGCDIVQIPRIQRLYEKYGKRFENYCFTDMEQTEAQKKKDIVEFYAKRYAAKEAFAKALRTGFGEKLNFQDISVVNDVNGAPSFIFSQRIQKMLGKKTAHLSISDDPPCAMAVVLIN